MTRDVFEMSRFDPARPIATPEAPGVAYVSFTQLRTFRRTMLRANGHQKTPRLEAQPYSVSPGGATSNADAPSRSMAFCTRPDRSAGAEREYVSLDPKKITCPFCRERANASRVR
jgi:hypothetical protein